MKVINKVIMLIMALTVTLFSSYANAQSIVPAPGINTVCPGELVNYTLSLTGSGLSSCTSFTWTITNGSFNYGSSVVTKTTTTPSVDVYWNDAASTGTLKVTSSSCSGGTLLQSFTYSIRSLQGRVPANIRTSSVLPYCSTSSIMLAVDVMFLENTGGTTGIPQKRADGYEWTLPTGWSSNGASGTFRTTTEYITITPDNGCSGGTATVRAYINSCTSGYKYSSPASISLNRTTPTITVAPPVGYDGAKCGQVEPVTFTVTPISCAKDYLWVFPSGWLQTPVYTSKNSITVTPSGGGLDAGDIKVTVNLTCGAELPSSPYKVKFTPPTITVPNETVCSSNTNVSILNVVGDVVTVNWLLSSNMSLVSGQGTKMAVVKALTSSTSGAGTINATVSCPNTTVAPLPVWVGLPNETGLDLAVQFGPTLNTLCWDVTQRVAVLNSNHSTQRIIDYVWNPSSFSSYFVGYDWSPLGNHGIAEFKVNNTAPTTTRLMGVKAQNSCGSSIQYWEGFNAMNCQGGPGGMDRISGSTIPEETPETGREPVYPIPANNKVFIEVKTNSVTTLAKLYNSSSSNVVEVSSDESKFFIPTENLPNGLYYLIITNSNERYERRVLIQH